MLRIEINIHEKLCVKLFTYMEIDVCFPGNVIEVNILSVNEKNSFDLAIFQASAEVQLGTWLFRDCMILFRRMFRDSLSFSSSRAIQSERNWTESPLELTDRLSCNVITNPAVRAYWTCQEDKSVSLHVTFQWLLPLGVYFTAGL